MVHCMCISDKKCSPVGFGVVVDVVLRVVVVTGDDVKEVGFGVGVVDAVIVVENCLHSCKDGHGGPALTQQSRFPESKSLQSFMS